MSIFLWVLLSIIFIVLNAIDTITTEFATKKLGIQERNPLAKWIVHKHFNWAVVLKYFFSAIVIIICWDIGNILPLIVYDIIFVFVCVNNIITIHVIKRKLFALSMNA